MCQLVDSASIVLNPFCRSVPVLWCPVESLSQFMFECSANVTLRSELFDNLRKVPGGAEKLRQLRQLYLVLGYCGWQREGVSFGFMWFLA